MALTEQEQLKVKELLSSDDGRILQSYIDQRVTAAIKSLADKNPSTADLVKRLNRIEQCADSNQKQLEMKVLVLRKCYEKKIDYNLVEKLGIRFDDEKSIDEKLNILNVKTVLDNERDMNASMLNGYRPGMGKQETDTTHLGIPKEQWEKLSMAEKQIIEAGRTNT